MMYSKRFKGSMIVALGLTALLGLASAASADTVDVAIQGFAFDPTPLTITAGTSVRWTNMDATTHTSTSDASVWDSGNLSNGQSFVYTFNDPGEFPYHCEIHTSMTATVIVEAAPVPGLGDWGVMLLIAALIGAIAIVIRRKTQLA